MLYTFGNASGIDRKEGLVAIKPSGVPYEELTPEHMVISDLEGKIVEGKSSPSSDLPTHLELYKHFPNVGGVAHTHSEFATAWAQAETPIPCFGTTHADYFHGRFRSPTPHLRRDCQRLRTRNRQGHLPDFREARSGCSSRGAGRRTCSILLGADAAAAAHNAVILEYVARMAYHTLSINAESLGRSPANCTTNIFCASTDATPTTDR